MNEKKQTSSEFARRLGVTDSELADVVRQTLSPIELLSSLMSVLPPETVALVRRHLERAKSPSTVEERISPMIVKRPGASQAVLDSSLGVNRNSLAVQNAGNDLISVSRAGAGSAAALLRAACTFLAAGLPRENSPHEVVLEIQVRGGGWRSSLALTAEAFRSDARPGFLSTFLSSVDSPGADSPTVFLPRSIVAETSSLRFFSSLSKEFRDATSTLTGSLVNVELALGSRDVQEWLAGAPISNSDIRELLNQSL